jgi:hypothetical protein
LRRDILAFATRTPSFLVGAGFGRIAFFSFPAAGMTGKTGVATLPSRASGCVVIGPAIDVSFFGIAGYRIWTRPSKKRGICCRALFSLTNDRDGGPNIRHRRTGTAPTR